MRISSKFDSGNIEAVDLSDPGNIQLKIEKDSNSDFMQWFHFRLQGAKNQPVTLKITNAGEATYAKAWKNYRACASYDRYDWFRVPTEFDGQNLVINHTPEFDSVYYAYFTPFSYERHLDLISEAQMLPEVKLVDLGQTVDGRDLNLLVAGSEDPAKKKVWIIARQHPGESMAEWFMEGLIERLGNSFDPVSRSLLEQFTFYLVPNMNPDGSYRGNLRSNAAGANLNREWLEPSMERSPEVYLVKKKIEETGVDLFLDIHGDEDLPYNFMSTCEEIPSYNEKSRERETSFIENLMIVNPDFQNKFGYEKGQFGPETLTLASNYIGETYKCLSLTVEMPFKDNADAEDERHGWSVERSKKLGESFLTTILYMKDKL